VAFRLREEKVAEEEIESRVRQALRFVELESAIEKYPADLSGGMQRRVSIARALVDNPALVFFDSPTAGLDPMTSQTIINLIMRGRDLQGVTSLLATQRVQDAFGLANYRFDKASAHVVAAGKNGNRGEAALTNILVLRDGQVYFEGAADSVLHSSDEYLKKFLMSAE
jgi:phospholipid/cholesterol/gamma-HCH transport system ATP-binding protein